MALLFCGVFSVSANSLGARVYASGGLRFSAQTVPASEVPPLFDGANPMFGDMVRSDASGSVDTRSEGEEVSRPLNIYGTDFSGSPTLSFTGTPDAVFNNSVMTKIKDGEFGAEDETFYILNEGSRGVLVELLNVKPYEASGDDWVKVWRDGEPQAVGNIDGTATGEANLTLTGPNQIVKTSINWFGVRGFFTTEGHYEFKFEIAAKRDFYTIKQTISFSFYIVDAENYKDQPLIKGATKRYSDINNQEYYYNFVGDYPYLNKTDEGLFEVVVRDDRGNEVKFTDGAEFEFSEVGSYEISIRIGWTINKGTVNEKFVAAQNYYGFSQKLVIFGAEAQYQAWVVDPETGAGHFEYKSFSGATKTIGANEFEIDADITRKLAGSGVSEIENSLPELKVAEYVNGSAEAFVKNYAKDIIPQFSDTSNLRTAVVNTVPVKISVNKTLAYEDQNAKTGSISKVWFKPTHGEATVSDFYAHNLFTEVGEYVVIVAYRNDEIKSYQNNEVLIYRQVFHFRIKNYADIRIQTGDLDQNGEINSTHIYSLSEFVDENGVESFPLAVSADTCWAYVDNEKYTNSKEPYENAPTFKIAKIDYETYRSYRDPIAEAFGRAIPLPMDGSFNFGGDQNGYYIFYVCYGQKSYTAYTVIIDKTKMATGSFEVGSSSGYSYSPNLTILSEDELRGVKMFGAGEVQFKWREKPSGIGFKETRIDFYKYLPAESLTIGQINTQTNGLSPRKFSTMPTTNFVNPTFDEEDGLYSAGTFSNAGIYVLTITDDLDNVNTFVVVIDESAPSFGQTGFIAGSSGTLIEHYINIVSGNVNITWGDHKTIAQEAAAATGAAAEQFNSLKNKVFVETSGGLALNIPIKNVYMSTNGAAYSKIGGFSQNLTAEGSYYFKIQDVLGNETSWYTIIRNDDAINPIVLASDASEIYEGVKEGSKTIYQKPIDNSAIIVPFGGNKASVINKDYVALGLNDVGSAFNEIVINFFEFTWDKGSAYYPFTPSLPIRPELNEPRTGKSAFYSITNGEGGKTKEGLYNVQFYSGLEIREFSFIVDRNHIIDETTKVGANGYETATKIVFGDDEKTATYIDFDKDGRTLSEADAIESNLSANFMFPRYKYNGLYNGSVETQGVYSGFKLNETFYKYDEVLGSWTPMGDRDSLDEKSFSSGGTYKVVIEDNVVSSPWSLFGVGSAEAVPNKSEIVIKLNIAGGVGEKPRGEFKADGDALTKYKNGSGELSLIKGELFGRQGVQNPDLSFDFDANYEGENFFARVNKITISAESEEGNTATQDIDIPANNNEAIASVFQTFLTRDKHGKYSVDILNWLSQNEISVSWDVRVKIDLKTTNAGIGGSYELTIDRSLPQFNLNRIKNPSYGDELYNKFVGDANYVYEISTTFAWTESDVSDTYSINFVEVDSGLRRVSNDHISGYSAIPFADRIRLGRDEVRYFRVTEQDGLAHERSYYVKIRGSEYKEAILARGLQFDGENILTAGATRIIGQNIEIYNIEDFVSKNPYFYIELTNGAGQPVSADSTMSQQAILQALNGMFEASRNAKKADSFTMTIMTGLKSATRTVYLCQLLADVPKLQIRAEKYYDNVVLKILNYAAVPAFPADWVSTVDVKIKGLGFTDANGDPIEPTATHNLAREIYINYGDVVISNKELVFEVSTQFGITTVVEYHGASNISTGINFYGYTETGSDGIKRVGDARGVMVSFATSVYDIILYRNETIVDAKTAKGVQITTDDINTYITISPTAGHFIQDDKDDNDGDLNSWSVKLTEKISGNLVSLDPSAIAGMSASWRFAAQVSKLKFFKGDGAQIDDLEPNGTYLLTGSVSVVVNLNETPFGCSVYYNSSATGNVILAPGQNAFVLDKAGNYSVYVSNRFGATEVYNFTIASLKQTAYQLSNKENNLIIEKSPLSYTKSDSKKIDLFFINQPVGVEYGDMPYGDETQIDALLSALNINLITSNGSVRNKLSVTREADGAYIFKLSAEGDIATAVEFAVMVISNTEQGTFNSSISLSGVSTSKELIDSVVYLAKSSAGFSVSVTDGRLYSGNRQGNIIYANYYRNGVLLGKIYADSAFGQTELNVSASDAGIYTFELFDWAGTRKTLVQGKTNIKTFTVINLGSVPATLNGQVPVDGLIYSNRLTISVLDLMPYGLIDTAAGYISKMEVYIDGALNSAKSFEFETKQSQSEWVFDQVGNYQVIMTYRFGQGANDVVKTTYNFQIHAADANYKTFNFSSANDVKITRIVRAGVDITKNFDLNSNIKLDAATGLGRYYITYRVLGTNLREAFDLNISVNIATIARSQMFSADVAFGGKKTGNATVSYNVNQIYAEYGASRIIIKRNGVEVAQIAVSGYIMSENGFGVEQDAAKATRQWKTPEEDFAGIYTVQLLTSRGDLITSESFRVSIPLNSLAIILIWVGGLILGALIWLTIRMRMKKRIVS
ncbi:MAG: hypothetical protein LBM01_01635 [Christensenellaceae bacterium]|jgi:hypothetical protein|nr:hypothetical protein [Christensenellaceae bacterium]